MRHIFKQSLKVAVAACVAIPMASVSSSASAATSGQWVKTFRGAGSQSIADIVVDRRTNHTFLIGTTSSKPAGGVPITDVDNGANLTAFVSRINLDGVVQWTKIIRDTTNNRSGNAIALGADGSIYALSTESARRDGASFHVRVTKYDQAGTQQWTRFIGSANGQELGYDIEVAGTSIAVVYSTTGLIGARAYGLADVVVTTLNPSTGAIVRSQQVGGTENDVPAKVKFMPSGRLLVSGTTWGKPFLPSRSLFRVDSDFFWFQTDLGNSSVVKSFQWGSVNSDYLTTSAIQSTGQFYFGGYTYGSYVGVPNRGQSDGYLSGFSSTGLQQWQSTLGTNGHDRVTDMQPSPNSTKLLFVGNTYGVWHQGTNGGIDIIGGTIQSTGVLSEKAQLGTSGNDHANSLSLRSDEKPVVAGETRGSFGSGTPSAFDGYVMSTGTTVVDFLDYRGAIANATTPPKFEPVFPVGSTVGQPAGEGIPVVDPTSQSNAVPTDALCNEVAAPKVLYRRQVATCAGLTIKQGTTTRIRLSLRNAAGVCSLSPRKRLKLTASGTCKVKIRATQSNGSTKAVWINYTVS